jgi:hypothetical protein
MTQSCGDHTDVKTRVKNNLSLLYNYIASVFVEGKSAQNIAQIPKNIKDIPQNVVRLPQEEKIKPIPKGRSMHDAGYAFVVPASLGDPTKQIAVVVHPDKISLSSRDEAARSAVYRFLDGLLTEAEEFAALAEEYAGIRSGIEYIPSPPHPLQRAR